MTTSRPVQVGDFLMAMRASRRGVLGQVVEIKTRGHRDIRVHWEDGSRGALAPFYVHSNPGHHEGFLLLGRAADPLDPT